MYCRFLLLHLPDPMACLREMRDVLRPGGIIVVEDGDLASATSVPPGSIDAFADLFCRFAPMRGLDYRLARDLYHMVIRAGFADVNVEIHQPAITRGENRNFLKWSVEEAGPSFVGAGVTTSEQLSHTLVEMQKAIDDPGRSEGRNVENVGTSKRFDIASDRKRAAKPPNGRPLVGMKTRH